MADTESVIAVNTTLVVLSHGIEWTLNMACSLQSDMRSDKVAALWGEKGRLLQRIALCGRGSICRLNLAIAQTTMPRDQFWPQAAAEKPLLAHCLPLCAQS